MFKLVAFFALLAVAAANPGAVLAPAVSYSSGIVRAAPLGYAAAPVAYAAPAVVRAPLAYSAPLAYAGAPVAYAGAPVLRTAYLG